MPLSRLFIAVCNKCSFPIVRIALLSCLFILSGIRVAGKPHAVADASH